MSQCPFCGDENREKCINWKKVKFTECAQIEGKTTLNEKQYKKWRNENCKDRQIANLQASRDRWKEYGMSLKRQQYQDLITEDMLAQEFKAIDALKAAGEWEEIE